MTIDILNLLSPVRHRLRLQSMIRMLGVGMFVGGFSVLLLGIVRVVFHADLTLPAAAGVFSLCACAGATIGLVLHCSWREAAVAVDHHYQLKDRTSSALQFSGQIDRTAFHELQLEDATQHLRNVDAGAVVPLTLPQRWAWLAVVLMASVGLLIAPLVGEEFQPPTPTPQQLSATVAEIRNEIDDLDALAQEAAVDELKNLVTRLRQDLKHLETPTGSLRESLKTVSEMQQKMQAMMAEMNVAAMDAELRHVAEAMSTAKPFQPTAAALQKQDLDKAARELERITPEDLSPEKMDRAESRPTAEKLTEAAAAAKEKGLQNLSEQLSQLSEAVKSGDAKQSSEQSEKLAQTIKRHSLNKQLNRMLSNKSEQLGQSKQHLAAHSQSEGDGAMSGSGQNLAKGKSNKTSDSSSQKAGAKSAGNINGPKTQLQSERQMARLTGELGEDGDSEIETTTSRDAQQRSQRLAQEAFTRYQKMSDAVLDAEPIPLGHRRTIQRYFELIRPSGAGADRDMTQPLRNP